MCPEKMERKGKKARKRKRKRKCLLCLVGQITELGLGLKIGIVV